MYSAWHESGLDTQAGASSKVQMGIPVPRHGIIHAQRGIIHVLSQNSQPSEGKVSLRKVKRQGPSLFADEQSTPCTLTVGFQQIFIQLRDTARAATFQHRY